MQYLYVEGCDREEHWRGVCCGGLPGQPAPYLGGPRASAAAGRAALPARQVETKMAAQGHVLQLPARHCRQVNKQVTRVRIRVQE